MRTIDGILMEVINEIVPGPVEPCEIGDAGDRCKFKDAKDNFCRQSYQRIHYDDEGASEISSIALRVSFQNI